MGPGHSRGPRHPILVPGYETRSRRAFRQTLMRMGIWVFVLLFVASIVGVAIVTVRAR